MPNDFIYAKQLAERQDVLTSGGILTGEPGEWLVHADGKVYLASNIQFNLLWKETAVKGVYESK